MLTNTFFFSSKLHMWTIILNIPGQLFSSAEMVLDALFEEMDQVLSEPDTHSGYQSDGSTTSIGVSSAVLETLDLACDKGIVQQAVRKQPAIKGLVFTISK